MDTNMLDKLQSTAVILTDPQTILSLTSGNPLTQLHSPFDTSQWSFMASSLWYFFSVGSGVSRVHFRCAHHYYPSLEL